MNEWRDNLGVMPVPKGTLVDVRYRDGYIQDRVPAGEPAGMHQSWAEDWSLADDGGDILAWRLAAEEVEDPSFDWVFGDE